MKSYRLSDDDLLPVSEALLVLFQLDPVSACHVVETPHRHQGGEEEDKVVEDDP